MRGQGKGTQSCKESSGSCAQVNPGLKGWWQKDCFFLKEQVLERFPKPRELQEAIDTAVTWTFFRFTLCILYIANELEFVQEICKSSKLPLNLCAHLQHSFIR